MFPRWMLAAGVMFALSAEGGEPRPAKNPEAKIGFDLTKLDADGLRGPADGKVSVAYEFAIPDTAECRKEVRKIDPSVSFMPGARGRVGAGKGECLCIGSTNQPKHRVILRSLAGLPYVKRIIECHFE